MIVLAVLVAGTHVRCGVRLVDCIVQSGSGNGATNVQVPINVLSLIPQRHPSNKDIRPLAQATHVLIFFIIFYSIYYYYVFYVRQR